MKKIILAVIILFILIGAYFLYRKPGGEYLITPRLIDFIDFPQKEDSAKYFLTLKVAVASMLHYENKEENIKEIERIIEKTVIDYPDVKLIAFGEASLGLYSIGKRGRKYMWSIAEPLNGRFIKKLAYFTERYNVYIAVGIIEAKEGKLWNSLVVINPKGKIEAVHRKMLLNSVDERNGITKSDANYQVFEVEAFKIGLAIGSEADDRWLHEQYKNEKINALICPLTSELSFMSKWLNCWPYGKLYNAWIISPNRYGTEDELEYDGIVFAAAPTGYMHYSERPENNIFIYTIGK